MQKDYGPCPKPLLNNYNHIDDQNNFICFVCGKSGHIAKVCRFWKHGANVIEEPLVTMTTKINFVKGSGGWWVDSGASRHVSYSNTLFKSYNLLKDKRKIILGDLHTTKVWALVTFPSNLLLKEN